MRPSSPSSPSARRCWGPNVYAEVPDGGWGWAVAAAFFLVEICTYGTLKSLGVFLEDLMEDFQESNSRVSWVISICVFVFTFTAPLSTWLSNRFGHRPVVMVGGFLMSLGSVTSAFVNSISEMYITMGIVTGLSYSLSFLPTLTLLAQYFSRRRALVTSVASSGECVAMFVFAPALTALKQHIGWRGCLVVLGVVQSAVVGCGLVLRPIVVRPAERWEEDGSAKEALSLKQMEAIYELENEQTRTSISSGVSGGSGDSGVTSLQGSNLDLRTAAAAEDRPGETTPGPLKQQGGGEEAGPPQSPAPKLLDFSVLRDRAFIWYSLFGLFATLGFFAPQLYIIQLSRSRGVAAAAASGMLSVMAVAEFLGRLSIGLALSRARCRKTLVLLACVVLLSLVLAVFAAVRDFWGLAVCAALYGFLFGTVGSTHIPLLAEDDVVGIAKMPSCVGVYVFIQSFAGLAGPPLGGVLVDLTENYGAAFYSCAAGMALSAVCLALVFPAKSGACCRQRAASEEEEEPDFLDVDLLPDDSPARRAKDPDLGTD
ncbi:solute carrier family 16 member 6b [Salarias fasciatus]|uniref:Monocarboxylate transporter 7 n=1 Tax=Salarias fasciatus TaxID=181472 RepID=A0A672GP20_SALFA|nr:monocarboxylate transporter 7-like [Salarias fasciatus]XP_029945299.1 monocarboxylate transporter 7-like [Salarias fasciatus]